MLEKFNMDQCNLVHNPAVPGLKLTKDEEGTKVDGTSTGKWWEVLCA